MQAYSVTELAEAIRAALERAPNLRDLWVGGEVSSAFTSAAGHVYFTLKDEGAAVRSVLFSSNPGAEHLTNGAQVNAHGRISHYTVRGDTQLYVDAVVPAGAGVLAAEFERLRAKLEGEGLFDPSRKRLLPEFPRRIGVVTSEQGAVIHDILNVLNARYRIAEVVLCPATVQGDEAPAEITDAIRTLNAQGDIDVIIVGRGGGSMEDLWAFNTEEVARAIHGSHAPVVSAVGHESDVTIADFVADLRAPTPSAAAAAVAPDGAALRSETLHLAQRAAMAVNATIQRDARSVGDLVAALRRRLPDTDTQRQRVDDTLERGRRALEALLLQSKERTEGLAGRLAALSPLAVLERGYAVLTNPTTGNAVASVANVQPGDIVHARVRDGGFDAEVR